MTTNTPYSQERTTSSSGTYLVSAIGITLLLFFIDEGYYDLRWMKSGGNWIAFLIYATAIFVGQLLFSKVILRKYKGPGKTAISIIAGATLGFLIVVGLLFTRWEF